MNPGKVREEGDWGKHERMRWMTPKEQGEWAELYFMLRASEEGLVPLRPWGERRYDVGIDYEGRFLRVQVKSSVYVRRGNSYSLNVMGPKRKPYKPEDIDFVAILLIPLDIWFVVPYGRMVSKNGKQRCSIHFTAGSLRGKYVDCKEAFWLLRGEKGSGGAGDRLVGRLRQMLGQVASQGSSQSVNPCRRKGRPKAKTVDKLSKGGLKGGK